MQRRDFLKLASIVGLSSSWSGMVWAKLGIASRALPVPPLVVADAEQPVALTLQTGTSYWHAGLPTPTWGINGPFLGPALQLQRGQRTAIKVINQLPEETTIHWHGLEIPGDQDGGPHQMIAPGASWTAQLTLDQPAATCWFHPHPHQVTGRHVAMGLAGLLLLEDDESRRLALPKQWGVDDIPLILQDRRLQADGQIDYQLDVMSAAVGWFGDVMLTNGAVYPQHRAPKGWLRLRLLNGANARSMKLACSDGQPLQVIASDGGFLAAPVAVPELELLPGERFEVLVSTHSGKPFDLLLLPVGQMGMTLAPFDKPLPVLQIQPSEQTGVTDLPASLVALPVLVTPLPAVTQTLHLSMDPELDRLGMQALMDKYGPAAMGSMTGGHAMHAMHGMPSAPAASAEKKVSDPHAGHGASSAHAAPSKAASESVSDEGAMSMTAMAHGEHAGHDMAAGQHDMNAASSPLDILHGNRINGQTFSMTTPAFHVPQGQWQRWIISGKGDMMLHPFHVHGCRFRILRENGQTPPLHRQGWKDIVRVEGDESEILVQFRFPAGQAHPYMAHCHLLEHEDTGMMLSFTVG
nr:multicopper oxidase CueO [Plesiomonas shigelloides]